MKIYLLLILSCLCCWGFSSEMDPLTARIHYNPEEVNKIGYLSLPRNHSIDASTALRMKFALEEYRRQQVAFIVLHLNTPGGEVFAATEMAEYLRQIDQRDHIPVVAVIDNWALSAGALLAYSCRFIAVSDQALMGAAEPIMTGSSGQMESAPEKIKSALRAAFGSTAKIYGRNPLIAEAMVDKDLILIKRRGEIVKLDAASGIQEGDEVLTAQGKLLTLDADQLMELQIANLRLPASGNLLELPFFSQIPLVERLDYENWKIDFFAFLTHPLVGSLLMIGLILGIYMEVQNPGTFVSGFVALGCLGLILLSHFSTQAVDWLEIGCLLAGLLLLAIEVFVLPGFGVVGFFGILLIFIGVVSLLLPAWNSTQFSWDFEGWNLSAIAFMQRLEWLLGALLVSLVLLFLLSRFATPRFLVRSRMILHEDQEGSVAGIEREQMPQVGMEGLTLTPLYPGGKIQIADQIYPVLSEGGCIEKGEKVLVSKIQGSGILVRKK